MCPFFRLDEMHKASVESAAYFREQPSSDEGIDSIFKFKYAQKMISMHG